MIFLYVIVSLALVFDFINGFHDSANSIANVVSTKVLSPIAAVSAAAFFNFIAFTVFPMKVAHTIGKGVVTPEVINMNVIGAALVAAITWNLLTWWWGLPSSSSHTIVGGLIGAAVASSGFGAIIGHGVLWIVAFIFIAPLMGMFLSHGISSLVMWICRPFAPAAVDKVFRKLQLVSSSALSLGHGGNDAQKSMGIIWLALILSGTLQKGSDIPFWVKISCQLAIALGTLFGGWRIVKTMGQKITKIKPFEGVSAETAGSITLFIATHFGIPVSTTHTITGAIIGVGARRGVSAVRWGVTTKIMWAWILTIPISGLIGAFMYWIFTMVHPIL
jgi:inorganic phosphate transporter, PiT family